MSHRANHDDRDDHDGAGTTRLPRWVLYCILSVGIATILGFLTMLVLFAFNPPPPSKRLATPLPRAQFKTVMMGRTMAETIDMLGVPDRTTNERNPGSTWTYGSKAYDPTNGNPDFSQELHFDNSVPPRVASVESY